MQNKSNHINDLVVHVNDLVVHVRVQSTVTVNRKTNFLVNLYWDNKYSDSHYENSKNNPTCTKNIIRKEVCMLQRRE